MYACCVSSHSEGTNLEPKPPPGFSVLTRPGSSAARALVGGRSSLGLLPNSPASLAVSVALLVGTFFAKPGLWDGSGGAKELEPIRKQYLQESICRKHASLSIPIQNKS